MPCLSVANAELLWCANGEFAVGIGTACNLPIGRRSWTSPIRSYIKKPGDRKFDVLPAVEELK